MCLGFRGFRQTTHEVETIRRAIGNGIELTYDADRLTIKNVSEIAIFVQSRQLNDQFTGNMTDDIIKIPSCHEADIFSVQALIEKVKLAEESGFESVYKTKDDCILRSGR